MNMPKGLRGDLRTGHEDCAGELERPPMTRRQVGPSQIGTVGPAGPDGSAGPNRQALAAQPDRAFRAFQDAGGGCRSGHSGAYMHGPGM